MIATGFRIGLVALSTCLSAAGVVPAIAATIRGTARPRVVTWLTWSLLTAVAGAASASAGDYPSAAFSLIGTVVTAAVVVAGVRFGDRSLNRLDITCLLLVAAGLVLWLTLNRPGIAVVAACVIDFVGLVPTLVHAWRSPREEPPVTYALIAAAGACATGAAWGTWTVTAVAYPIYVLVSMGACWAIIVLRRPFDRAAPAAVDLDDSERESERESDRPAGLPAPHEPLALRAADPLDVALAFEEATTTPHPPRHPTMAQPTSAGGLRNAPPDWPLRSPSASRFRLTATDAPPRDTAAADADDAAADGANAAADDAAADGANAAADADGR